MISILKRSMSQNSVNKLINNAEIAEKKLSELRSKLEEIKKIKIEERIKELTEENKILSVKVATAKADLIRLETSNGKKQYPLPGKISEVPAVAQVIAEEPAVKGEKQPVVKKVKETAKKPKEKPELVNDSVIDVRKLDFRIGKIIDINKHPDADSLYVEKIDCGEEKPRTVVSGLVNHVPIDEMRDRIVMILANLKPVKMRGVTSEAMVMCASSPDKVEVLIPPNGAVPGDLVECENYPREPEAILNPKKKIFESCAPDLMTNNEKVACYKGSPLIVPGKGKVVAPTLAGVNVK
ncbi:aminoacyl tRNA synthase complex-interacting multifunctional protein 1 [Trichoplusia ni]|uniref:Aminoacyl tRNA synthase complex-interacting multifunctional protein 1 n=1 Tax=Trichoplusia ni TaxID=7111 RepID=A0A7E5VZ77_TRINI|nr:aminoacyl tRNA synthase complex-interacting multifunctional protein 1 [Trichoplusia ni]